MSAQAASWSLWHSLQALGDLKAIVAAGIGGRIEWSVRIIAANWLIGMWQAMHESPAPAGLVVAVGGGVFHDRSMARHARLVDQLAFVLRPAAGPCGTGCNRACPTSGRGSSTMR